MEKQNERKKSTFTLESSALYTYYKPGYIYNILISTPWFVSVYLLGESMFLKYGFPITQYFQIIFHETKMHAM